MALIRELSKDGIVYPQAYSRIDVVRVTPQEVMVGILTYEDFDARMADANSIVNELHFTTYEVVAQDVYPSAYAFVKTLPGFEHAIDHNNPPEAPAPDVIDTTADVVGNDFIN